MKTSAILLIALLMLAFTTQVYGATVSTKLGQATEVQIDTSACMQDVYQLGLFAVDAYNFYVAGDIPAIYSLLVKAYPTILAANADCF